MPTLPVCQLVIIIYIQIRIIKALNERKSLRQCYIHLSGTNVQVVSQIDSNLNFLTWLNFQIT